MDCLQLPFIRVEEAFSWTQRFLTRKFGPKIEVYLWQKDLKANVCKNSKFHVNRKKNSTGRQRATKLPFWSALHERNDTTNPFGYKLGESTENNKARALLSSQVRKQFKLLKVPFKPLRGCCEVINLWIAMFENSAKIYFYTFAWFDPSVKSYFLWFPLWFCWDHFMCIY